jgi:hypothetical protein
MGQYYKAILLNKTKKQPLVGMSSYDFGSGSKLMEHSWMKNDYVGFVEAQLLLEPRPLVWAGDYADKEGETDRNLWDMTESIGTLSPSVDIPEGKSKYDFDFGTVLPKRFKYLINYDKKEFVDKTKSPINDGWQIHPLPLLTCEGNGRGGGDYRGDSDLIGVWSRDTIGIVSKKTDIPKGFKEIICDFKE